MPGSEKQNNMFDKSKRGYVQKGNPFPVTSCGRRRNDGSPLLKGTKGGGTTKVCLPKAKIDRMSKAERQRVISAKQRAGKAGKYKRSSKSNVTGTASRNLKHWVQQDWRQVGNPSKKCGEK